MVSWLLYVRIPYKQRSCYITCSWLYTLASVALDSRLPYLNIILYEPLFFVLRAMCNGLTGYCLTLPLFSPRLCTVTILLCGRACL
jgi:hypothetical protein